MSGGKGYVLDANVFIEASQRYYGLDFCPGFWVALRRQHTKGSVASIDKIAGELLALGDQLAAWAKERAKEGFFKATADRTVFDEFTKMVKWVQGEPQFTADAHAKFAGGNDGWLVAYAKVNGLIVVTHEQYRADAKRTVPIPNVCLEFGVPYCNTFEMLRDLNVRLILKGKRQPK